MQTRIYYKIIIIAQLPKAKNVLLLLHWITGFRHNINCGNEYNFICKRTGTVPANTTVAPTETPKGGCPPYWVKFN